MVSCNILSPRGDGFVPEPATFCAVTPDDYNGAACWKIGGKRSKLTNVVPLQQNIRLQFGPHVALSKNEFAIEGNGFSEHIIGQSAVSRQRIGYCHGNTNLNGYARRHLWTSPWIFLAATP